MWTGEDEHMIIHNKSIFKNWKAWIGIIIIIILIITIATFQISKKQTINNKQIEFGDMVILNKYDKELLRSKTIEYIKQNLKTPNIAQFEEEFDYICNEENIIEVKGYVDSQNSFGAIIRGEFTCQYFAIKNDITTLVLLTYNDTELVNIKDAYIEEYKKQEELDNINESGKELNQEKLEYIKEEFNKEEFNDIGKITNIIFNEKESIIDVQIIAKSSKNSQEQKEYWADFNICSVLHYFNDFNIIGMIRMNLYDYDNNKILELNFDDDFIKNKWKDNSQINKVKELFGENYKEIIR